MRTARMLEAEWRQVLQGSVSTGQRKMSQVLGAFGLLDFTMLQPVLTWRAS
jgi:plasmid stability protein